MMNQTATPKPKSAAELNRLVAQRLAFSSLAPIKTVPGPITATTITLVCFRRITS